MLELVEKEASSKKTTATTKKKVSSKVVSNKVEDVSSGSKSHDTTTLEMKLEGVDSKISNLIEELINTVRAMENSGSRLNEQESKFVESINEFKIYKEQQQKVSSVVVLRLFLVCLSPSAF